MNERANRSAHADWHNPAVFDEAAARFRRTLGQAWIAARSGATGASVFGVGFQMGSVAPEEMPNGQGILAKPQVMAKPQVQDFSQNHTGWHEFTTKYGCSYVKCAHVAI